jgi:murein L,D-transpeptidase YafK
VTVSATTRAVAPILIFAVALALVGTAEADDSRADVSGRAEPSFAQILLDAALAGRGFSLGDPAHIRIFKEERELELWLRSGDGFELLHVYDICKLSGKLGPKLREGDEQAPEGFYAVSPDRLNPHSRYHLSFDIGYPNEYDRVHGRTGSEIMVHGSCDSIGCYAMTDPAIEEIYAIVESALDRGQPVVRVHVYPFRMTGENLHRHRESEWFDFWLNLREAYDAFETRRVPADAAVEDLRYVIAGSAGSGR